MPLTQKHIEALKEIFEQEFGYRPDDREAWNAAIRLTTVVTNLNKSDTSSEE